MVAWDARVGRGGESEKKVRREAAERVGNPKTTETCMRKKGLKTHEGRKRFMGAD